MAVRAIRNLTMCSPSPDHSVQNFQILRGVHHLIRFEQFPCLLRIPVHDSCAYLTAVEPPSIPRERTSPLTPNLHHCARKGTLYHVESTNLGTPSAGTKFFLEPFFPLWPADYGAWHSFSTTEFMSSHVVAYPTPAEKRGGGGK